jgi:type II secretory pathway pseudopilin PulG
MTSKRRAGFTIIEVVLFLAVSGLLITGILAGSGMAISQQRYKDAVATLRSDIQQLYEGSIAVQNDERSGSVSGCGSGGAGRSDCVIVGNLMTVSEGTVTQYRVIGDDVAGSGASEVAKLNSLNPRVLDAGVVSDMEWGTTIGAGSTSGNGSMSILVLRSPDSGLIYTFFQNGVVDTTRTVAAQNEVRRMVAVGSMGRVNLCVNPTGWTVAEPMAIIVGANAASASAIEVMTRQLYESKFGNAGWPC